MTSVGSSDSVSTANFESAVVFSAYIETKIIFKMVFHKQNTVFFFFHNLTPLLSGLPVELYLLPRICASMLLNLCFEYTILFVTDFYKIKNISGLRWKLRAILTQTGAVLHSMDTCNDLKFKQCSSSILWNHGRYITFKCNSIMDLASIVLYLRPNSSGSVVRVEGMRG